MRAFAILVALLLSPLAAAISDLSIYSEAKYYPEQSRPLIAFVDQGVVAELLDNEGNETGVKSANNSLYFRLTEKRFNKLKSDNKIISELHFWDKLFGLTYEQAKEKYLGEVGR